MTGKLANRYRRSLLTMLAVGMVVVAGSLGATGVSAATPAGATIGAEQHGNVISPSYYVTPSGQRLSAAEVAASGDSPAASAALPVFFISNGESGDLSGIHACQVTGSAGGVEGVECADLYVIGYPLAVNVYAAGEGYCQAADGLLQCPAINFIAEVAVAQASGQAGISGPTTVGCGGGYPACAKSDRNPFTLLAASIAPVGCNINPGQGNEFWTVVLPKTVIAIPTLNSRINTSAAGNLSSPHAIVCLNS